MKDARRCCNRFWLIQPKHLQGLEQQSKNPGVEETPKGTLPLPGAISIAKGHPVCNLQHKPHTRTTGNGEKRKECFLNSPRMPMWSCQTACRATRQGGKGAERQWGKGDEWKPHWLASTRPEQTKFSRIRRTATETQQQRQQQRQHSQHCSSSSSSSAQQQLVPCCCPIRKVCYEKACISTSRLSQLERFLFFFLFWAVSLARTKHWRETQERRREKK